MSFWRATDGAQAAAVGVAAPVPAEAEQAYELSAIGLYLTSGYHRGWVATNGQRTSDWLNHTDPLPLREVKALETDEIDVTPPMVDPSGADVTSVPADDIQFVIPPPLPPNRHLRLHRRRVHVNVHIGQVTIGGMAHIRPGAEFGEHIFRSGRRFVPLTDAEVLLGDGSEPWPVAVVIINATAVTEVRGMQDRQGTPAPIAPQVRAVQPPAATPAAPTTASLAEPLPESLAPREKVLLTALELLLAEGVLDIVEFQTKRAGLVRR